MRVKDLIYITGGNTKIVIIDAKPNSYKGLWRGIVDDIDFKHIPFGNYKIEHLTVISCEDYLQIHIHFE